MDGNGMLSSAREHGAFACGKPYGRNATSRRDGGDMGRPKALFLKSREGGLPESNGLRKLHLSKASVFAGCLEPFSEVG